MIDPDVAFNHGVAHRLALGLATLVVGQTLPSESDVPFEPFTAALDRTTRVTVASFREAFRFGPDRDVVISSGARFFERMAGSVEDPGAQQVFAVLEHVMRRSLTGVKQVFVRGDGVVEVPFFLFGRLAAGPLVGLRSTAIET